MGNNAEFNTLSKDEFLAQCEDICREKVEEVVALNADKLDTENGRLTFEEQIYEVVLQMLSYVETENRKTRMEQQKRGIEAAKDAGIHFGNVTKYNPLDYVDLCRDVEDGVVSVKEAQNIIGSSYSTLRRMRNWLRTEGLL